MATSKTRLGRGLDSLIAGGAGRAAPSASSKAAPSRPPARPASKPAKPAPAPPAKPTPSAKAAAPKASPGKVAPKPAPKPVAAKPAAPAPTPAPAPQPAAVVNPPPAAPVATPAPQAAAATSTAAAGPAPAPTAASSSNWVEIPVADVVPNPFQPRREFNPESLKELAESILAVGVLQPILVRRVEGRYQLIAGERRWRACQLNKQRLIPARVVEAKDSSSAAMALIENLQRADLNPVEEALGYASLVQDFDLTQEEVAQRVGKSRSAVANALRLLSLSKESRGYLARGQLSVGHAKVLLGIEDVDLRDLLARRVVQDGLSVRQTEELVERSRSQRNTPGDVPAKPTPRLEDQAVKDIEKRLTSRFNTRVQVLHTPKRGKLVIEYFGNDDLQRLLEAMGVGS